MTPTPDLDRNLVKSLLLSNPSPFVVEPLGNNANKKVAELLEA